MCNTTKKKEVTGLCYFQSTEEQEGASLLKLVIAVGWNRKVTVWPEIKDQPVIDECTVMPQKGGNYAHTEVRSSFKLLRLTYISPALRCG